MVTSAMPPRNEEPPPPPPLLTSASLQDIMATAASHRRTKGKFHFKLKTAELVSVCDIMSNLSKIFHF